MKNNLDADTYEELRYAVNSAESVKLIEALIKSTAPAKLPDLMAMLNPVDLSGQTSRQRCSERMRTVILRSLC